MSKLRFRPGEVLRVTVDQTSPIASAVIVRVVLPGGFPAVSDFERAADRFRDD